jgi:hypothetical protein
MSGVELVTLFGNDLAEVSPAHIGVRVAGGIKVSARDLASVLLAMSVAELHGRGAATLAEEEVKRLFRASQVLTVCSNGDGQGFAGTVSRAARQGTAVRKLARAVLGGTVRTPELTLVGMAQSFLEPTGAVVAKQGMKRLGTAIGYPPFEINDAAADGLRGQWEPVRAGWESWKAANAAMAGPLVEACRKSLGDARDTSDIAV